MVVGEAPGKTEAMMGLPFVGASGQELRRMLTQAGIDPREVRFTNVFLDQPPKNEITAFCAKKAEVGKAYSLPPLSTGNYVRPEYLPELDRLKDEILSCNPAVIIALGNTATWALLRRTGITKLRGNVFPSELVPGFSVLPTYHPAAILREWSNRTIAVLDLTKAQRYVTTGFSVPRRELWLAPTIEEVRSFLDQFIFGARPPMLSFDIETMSKTITCIGFSPSEDRSITIPFYDPAKPDHNYWDTVLEEREAWKLCRKVLECDIPKLGQNGLYDIQYCYRHGIKVRSYLHDTMIRHHAIWPELPKGLGFMGSIFTDEAPWKLLRERNKENFKLEDE